MDINKAYSFLSKLKKNNNKEWFDQHRSEYLEIKEDFEQFITGLLKEISLFDESVKDLEAKKFIYRINRDVRFAADKSPYKTNLGATISPGGKNSGKAGYHLQLGPKGESFIAGGVYMPDAPALALIRGAIDYEGEKLNKIITTKNFVTYFGGMSGETVKTTPKGFKLDHPHMELLKHKSFLAYHKITDEEAFAKNQAKYIAKIVKEIKPLNDFLNKALAF